MLFVTIHETGNTSRGSGARNHANYLKGDTAAGLPVSWHYTTDDTETYQHVPETEDAFHAGDGGGNGNRQSIGIEICVNSDGNFQVAIDRTAVLVADICRRRNIPVENIRQHNHWSGKNCPQNIRAGRPHNWDVFISKVRAALGEQPTTPPEPPQAQQPVNQINVGDIVRINQGAKTFDGRSPASFVFNNVYVISSVSGERAILDSTGINTPYNVRDLTVVTPVKPNPVLEGVASWAVDSWIWGIENLGLNGLRPQDNITRQEVMLLLHRLYNFIVKK
jgi:hypothetical protein